MSEEQKIIRQKEAPSRVASDSKFKIMVAALSNRTITPLRKKISERKLDKAYARYNELYYEMSQHANMARTMSHNRNQYSINNEAEYEALKARDISKKLSKLAVVLLDEDIKKIATNTVGKKFNARAVRVALFPLERIRVKIKNNRAINAYARKIAKDTRTNIENSVKNALFEDPNLREATTKEEININKIRELKLPKKGDDKLENLRGFIVKENKEGPASYFNGPEEERISTEKVEENVSKAEEPKEKPISLSDILKGTAKAKESGNDTQEVEKEPKVENKNNGITMEQILQGVKRNEEVPSEKEQPVAEKPNTETEQQEKSLSEIASGMVGIPKTSEETSTEERQPVVEEPKEEKPLNTSQYNDTIARLEATLPYLNEEARKSVEKIIANLKNKEKVDTIQPVREEPVVSEEEQKEPKVGNKNNGITMEQILQGVKRNEEVPSEKEEAKDVTKEEPRGITSSDILQGMTRTTSGDGKGSKVERAIQTGAPITIVCTKEDLDNMRRKREDEEKRRAEWQDKNADAIRDKGELDRQNAVLQEQKAMLEKYLELAKSAQQAKEEADRAENIARGNINRRDEAKTQNEALNTNVADLTSQAMEFGLGQGSRR